jgi:hypothetical protein
MSVLSVSTLSSIFIFYLYTKSFSSFFLNLKKYRKMLFSFNYKDTVPLPERDVHPSMLTTTVTERVYEYCKAPKISIKKSINRLGVSLDNTVIS